MSQVALERLTNLKLSKSGPTPEPPLHVIVDEASLGAVRGWAVDPARPETSVTLKFLIDGELVHEAICDGNRLDVLESGLGPQRVGFAFSPPQQRLRDGLRHALSLQRESGTPVTMFVDGFSRVEIDLAQDNGSKTPELNILSNIDSFKDGHVQGWVLRPLETPEGIRLFGKATVAVFYNGQLVTQSVADMERPDVSKALNSEPLCGFRIKIAVASFTDSKDRALRLYVIPELRELTGSPCIMTAAPL